MKLVKILALVLSVCLLGTALIACDSGETKAEETTAGETTATTQIEVNLIIKEGSTTKYEGKALCNGTLGDAIEAFCAVEDLNADACFDENNLLVAIGELKSGDGKNFKAYYEDKGQGEAFEKIKDQTLEAGKTVVIVLE